MNFAFDTLHFLAGSGGPARVTEAFIDALRNLGDTVSTDGPEHPEPSRLNLLPSLLGRMVSGGSISRSASAEKLVCIAGEIWPVAAPGTIQVIFIHDTFALERSDWVKPAERFFQKRRVRWAEQYADLVVSPSEEMKRRLRELSPKLENRITVIPWGISQPFKDAAALQKHEKPYWVASGDTTPRKGLNELLAWYQQLEYPPRLHLTGHAAPTALPSGIEATGRLALNELARLITGAEAYLSFSHDEGYGLAIAEAASTGTPVVARRFPGGESRFPEGVYWFGTSSETGEALQQALSRPRVPPAWTRDLSWDRSAARLKEAILRIQ